MWKQCIKDVGTKLDSEAKMGINNLSRKHFTRAKWLRTHGTSSHVSFASAHLDSGDLVITPPQNASEPQNHEIRFKLSDIKLRDDLESGGELQEYEYDYIIFEYTGDHRKVFHKSLRGHFLSTRYFQITVGEKNLSEEGGSATDYSKSASAEIREAIIQAQTPSDWQPDQGMPPPPTEWSIDMRVRIVNGPRQDQRGTIKTVIPAKHGPGTGQFGVLMDDGSKLALQPLYLEEVRPGSPKGKGQGKHALSQSALVLPKPAPQNPQTGPVGGA